MKVSKQQVKATLEAVKRWGLTNSPEILCGTGVLCMISATIFAVKATPKAEKIIKCEESQLERPLTKPEVVKKAWKCYIPTMLMTIAGTSCMFASSTISHRRNIALAATATVAEGMLNDYKEKTTELFGEKKATEVTDGIAKDIVATKPVNEEFVIQAGGTHLCYDPLSGRYFRSDVENIRRAVNDLNKLSIDDFRATLNDFYYSLGIPTIDLGEHIGWNTDRMLEMRFSSQVSSSGEPCLVLVYETMPSPRYL